MEKDIILSTLNRLESKVDSMSTGLATNTAETKSHTEMLSDMKNVHTINGKIILDTRDEVKELRNGMLRIESWKNGQTVYQQKTLEDIIELKGRLAPVELDYKMRKDHKAEVSKSWNSILWKGVEKVVLILAGAVLISWRDITNNLK